MFNPPRERKNIFPLTRSPSFGDASGPTDNIEHLGLIRGWDECHCSLSGASDYQGSLKGFHDHSLLSSTVFLVVNCRSRDQPFRDSLSLAHPRLRLRGRNFKTGSGHPLLVL